MTGIERRKYKRVKGDIAVAVNDAYSNMITEARDISASGVCCKVTKEIPLMNKVVITLLLPKVGVKGKKVTEKVSCEGVVVRQEPVKEEPGAFIIAVFFANTGKSERKILEKYVESKE